MKLNTASVKAAFSRMQIKMRRHLQTIIVLLGFLLVSFFLIFGIATLGIQRDEQRWLPLDLSPQVSADYRVDVFSENQRLARINPDILAEVRKDALPTPTPPTPEIGTPTPTPTPTLTPEPADLLVNIGGPYLGEEGRPIALVATSPGLSGLIPGTISYAWDLDGNGVFDDDEGAEILAIYPNDAIYQISVQASDLLGRVATDTTTVTVENVAPLVDLGSDLQKNEGEAFQLIATVEDPGSDLLVYRWDFGDGTVNTINTLTPGHTYLDNGDYTLTLRVEDNDGGVGEDSIVVQVLNLPPLADAGPDHNVQEGSNVTFQGNGTDPAGNADPLTFAWDLNYDGFNFNTDLTGPTVSAFYGDGPQSFVVALRVEDGDGAEAIDTATVNVGNAPPEILVITTSNPREEGTAISIQVSATDVGSDTLTYAFDWENNGRYDEVNESGSASNVWENDGDYTVGVLVDDGDDGQAFSTVDLAVLNLPPLAVAAGPSGAVFEGTSINFSGAGSTDPGVQDILTYRWNFGDGATATGSQVSHTYPDNGVYSTTLTVTDDAGGSSVAGLSVTVDNANPVLAAGLDLIVDEGDNVTVNLSATATDPGTADTLTYAWDLNGDGTYDDATGPAPAPTLQLDGPDTFNVSVRVRDDDYVANRGEPGEAFGTLQVTINNLPPANVNANGPYDGREGMPVNLIAGTATDVASDTLTYEWDIDQDDVYDLVGQNVLYTWNRADTYDITLRVRDEDGGEAFDTAEVTILNGPPTAVAGGPYSGNESGNLSLPIEAIVFDASGSSDPTNDPLTYTWTFGDGTASVVTTSPTTNHVYRQDGSYTAQLQVDDGRGGSDIDSVGVTINNLPPIVTISPLSGPFSEFEEIPFSGTAVDPSPLDVINPSAYQWNFGDGVTASGPNARHTYLDDDDDDQYSVTLTVQDSGNPVLAGSAMVSVQVENLAPTAAITISPPPYREGVPVILGSGSSTDPSPADTLAYRWQVDDGLTNTTITNTTNTTITYAFPDNGVYTLTLRATDDDGDFGQITRTVTVTNVAPSVNITGEPYATTISSTINLSATGSDVAADPLTYAWDLDNNGSFETAGQAVPFSSTITGTFTVTVQVSDGDGGSATDSTTVTVNSVLPLALLGVGYRWFRRKRRHNRLRQRG